MDTATKTGLDALKTSFNKVVHQAAGATQKFIGNKIAHKIAKPKLGIDKNSRNAEEMTISPEKKQKV